MTPIGAFKVREAECPVPAASGQGLRGRPAVGVIDNSSRLLVLSPT